MAKKNEFKAVRSRRFCLVTYIERNALEKYLKNSEWVQHWAMCTHNRDLYLDDVLDSDKNIVHHKGDAKDVHTHVLLYTYDSKTSSAICSRFDNFSKELYDGTDTEWQNTLCQVMHDSSIQWRYLIHKDDNEKAQYEEIERICDDYIYWSKLDRTFNLNDSSNNTGLAMVDDLLSGKSTYEMIERYGKEYIYHSAHFKQVIRDMFSENTRQSFGGLADLCRFALADNTTYTQEQITIFFSILNYIQVKMADDKKYLEDTRRYLKG